MHLTYFGLALLVVLIWGFNFVAINVGLKDLPPLFLVFSRFFLTSIPLIFFVKKPKLPLLQIALFGLVMFALQFSFLFVGMYLGVSPGIAALIVQIQVFFTLVIGYFFFNEKSVAWQLIGCLISFIGLGIVALHIQGTVSWEGFFCLIGAALFWSLGNSISKKMQRVNTFSLAIWSSLIAWPPLLALSLIIEGPERIIYSLEHLSWLSLSAALYITYGSTLIGYGLWSYLVYHLPLFTISSFTILIPIVAILSSVLFLGEHLETWKILAALFTIFGISLNFFGKKISTYVRMISQKWR